MRWTYWILGLLICVANALSAPAHLPFGSQREPDISVLVESSSPIAPAIRRSMEKELRRLFSPSDTQIQIVFDRDPNENTVYESQVIMMRLVGQCDAVPAPSRYTHKPDTLGRTFITDGVILPFVELDCRQISGAIRQRLLTVSKEERPMLLGRAMARVLAHEIYHVLAATMEHTHHGIAAETMSAAQLTEERHDFRFEDFELMHLLPVMGTF